MLFRLGTFTKASFLYKWFFSELKLFISSPRLKNVKSWYPNMYSLPFAILHREYWTCNNFSNPRISPLGLHSCIWWWLKLVLHCSFLSSSSMLNNKQSFSNVPPFFSLSLWISLSFSLSQTFLLLGLFYKPFKVYGYGAWALWWLFHEVKGAFFA